MAERAKDSVFDDPFLNSSSPDIAKNMQSGEPRRSVSVPKLLRKRTRRRASNRHFFNPPGAQPGLLVTPLDAVDSKVELIAYGGGQFLEKHLEGGIDEIKQALERFPVVWVNIDGLGNAELIREISELLSFHKLAMEDVLSGHQRAKLEQYGDHLFITMRMPLRNEHLDTEQFSLFVGRNFVFTFQEEPGDCLEPVRDRIRTSRGRVQEVGPDYLAYALLDAVIDSYFPLLEQYGEALEALEDRIIEGADQSAISEIHALKRNLLTLRRSVWPLREVANTMIRDPHPLVAEETRVYLRDCYDHAVRIIDLVENYRELAADLMQLFLSIASNKMNEVVKVLTVISTIFIPLSFVAGVYGMNFNRNASALNMPELDWYYGYPFALSIMLAIALSLLFFFYRRGWIGGKSPLEQVRELRE